MQTTCGAAVITSDFMVLVGRATNSNNWSIPKGLNEEGEELVETALRELKEETGLIFTQENLKYCGNRIYKNNKKQLEMFYIIVDKIDVKEIKCESYFDYKGKMLPELCEFRLIKLNDLDSINIHETQKFLLTKLANKL